MTKHFTRALLGASALGFAASASAQLANPYDLTGYEITGPGGCTIEGILSNDLNEALTNGTAADPGEALRAYTEGRDALTADFRGSRAFQAFQTFLQNRRAQRQTQVVFLEFNDAIPTFDFIQGGTVTVVPDYIFTDEDIDEIVGQLETTFALYNVEFVTEQPAQGDFSVIQIGFNDNNPIDLSQGILFGRADNIDFGNNDRNDTAFADGSFWQLLTFFDSSFGTQNLQNFLGLPEPLTPEEVLEVGRASVVNQSANTAAHELGHILGLRHHDSIGAPGDGLPSTGAILPEDFIPVLETDLNADETTDHVMASGASVGLPLENPPMFDRFFSERSANKLAFNERGVLFDEDRLPRFGTPFIPRIIRFIANPLQAGQNAGKRLLARNWAAEGAISELGEEDTYAFFLRSGQVFNAEIISSSDVTIEDDIWGKLTLSYANPRTRELEVVAENQTTFEGREPLLFDFTIPQTGFYRLTVTAPDSVPLGRDPETGEPNFVNLSDFQFDEENTFFDIFGQGDYELFAYTVEGKESRRRRFASR